nr:sigma-70 family RNA polymerase sigma factor [Pedobacter sp. ASV2]
MCGFDEQLLWMNFLKGDKKSFEEIYHHYFQSLNQYAIRFNQDINFVDEAIQDLFVKLWQNKANLNIPQSPKHYLLKSLRNIIYNKITVVRKELYVGAESDMLAFEFDMRQEPSDYNKELIKRLMGDLTIRQREAVYLYYQEGLDYQEVADILKIKIGGTYKLIYRAVENMREQIKNASITSEAISPAKV